MKLNILSADGAKPLDADKPMSKEDQQTILDKIYDEDGITLMVEILTAVFNCTEDDLGKKFDVDSLNIVYAYVIRRDFMVGDILQSFLKRFTSMFGGEPSPPTSLVGS
jgi:hypothetical protein